MRFKVSGIPPGNRSVRAPPAAETETAQEVAGKGRRSPSQMFEVRVTAGSQ
jgi:hypothetical protein